MLSLVDTWHLCQKYSWWIPGQEQTSDQVGADRESLVLRFFIQNRARSKLQFMRQALVEYQAEAASLRKSLEDFVEQSTLASGSKLSLVLG